jgi:thiamine-monophosphate kinase
MPFELAEQFVNQLSGAVIIGEIVDGDRIDGLEMRSAFQHFSDSNYRANEPQGQF